jgi:hypothetical protein
MGFLSEAKSESVKVTKLRLIEDQLSEEEFQEFISALKDKSITSAAIYRVLKARGVNVSENSVKRYRSAL